MTTCTSGVGYVFLGTRKLPRSKSPASSHTISNSRILIDSCAQLFLFFHNLFVHISANYGFGQDQSTLSLDDGATAHKWEVIGQTFIIVGMGMSKMSLALFLLRIVVVRWQRLSIWIIGGSLCFASCLTAILCWLQVIHKPDQDALYCFSGCLTLSSSVYRLSASLIHESRDDASYSRFRGQFY